MHPRYIDTYVTPSGRTLACEYQRTTPGGMAVVWFPDGSSMTVHHMSVSLATRAQG